MTYSDRPFPCSRRDFYEALALIEHLTARGILMDRVEHIGHFMVSISRVERKREPRHDCAMQPPAPASPAQIPTGETKKNKGD